MKAKLTISALLFILLGATCLLEARHGGGGGGGRIHGGGGGGRRAGIYGRGHGGHYAYGGRRWYGRRGVGFGVGLGPLFVGSGVYGGYNDDDCYYDEEGRLLCYSPWA